MLVKTTFPLSLAMGENQDGDKAVFVNKGSSKKQQFASATDALEAAVKAKVPAETGVRVDGKYIPLSEAAAVKDLAAYVWQSEGRAPGWKVQLWTTQGADDYNNGVGRKKKPAKKAVAEKKAPAKNVPLF